ncbi:hypothetical protein DOT_1119 [Desulfosporosinus sp. OT]|nr:hypothetical protein DOT_1119 [Desulfosporosinus sp. OT]
MSTSLYHTCSDGEMSKHILIYQEFPSSSEKQLLETITHMKIMLLLRTARRSLQENIN